MKMLSVPGITGIAGAKSYLLVIMLKVIAGAEGCSLHVPGIAGIAGAKSSLCNLALQSLIT